MAQPKLTVPSEPPGGAMLSGSQVGAAPMRFGEEVGVRAHALRPDGQASLPDRPPSRAWSSLPGRRSALAAEAIARSPGWDGTRARGAPLPGLLPLAQAPAPGHGQDASGQRKP